MYRHARDPLQNLSERVGAAQGLVQSPGGYAKQTRAAPEPRHPSAHDGGGAGAGVLRRAGAPGVGRHHPLHPHPQEIRDFYKMYRPAPLVRAYCLEEKLQTPAKIYYKFEGNNTSGSHKLNSAIAQAYYAKMQGLTGVTTETGAGQWGTALAMACAYLGLDCKVFMVNAPMSRSPSAGRSCGPTVPPSPPAPPWRLRWAGRSWPSTRTPRAPGLRHLRGGGGRGIAPRLPLRPGQRAQPGDAPPVHHRSGNQNRHGSIRHHSRHHHRLRRRRQQPGRAHRPVHGGEAPGRAGLPDHCRGARLLPQLHRGRFAYDFCDTGMVCPLAKMYTLGSGFIPSANHAGGLRYHGMSPR